MEPPPARLDVRNRLSADEVSAICRVVEAAAEADGIHPLAEHVMLHLKHGGDPDARNLLLWAGGRLAGYAHLDTTDAVEGSSAELVVAPDARGRGFARRLVDELRGLSPDGRLRLWAHGNHPAADALAERLGLRRSRALWQMRRSLYAPLPAPAFPEDIHVRTFVVGQDEDAWVEVNNRAFADHPEQGRWTVEDLRVREQEPWFDPRGFFLAERDGRLAGFHWTKVHGHADDHDPIGEVYIVGVDPSAQGQGLGPALTLLGLVHLRSRGLAQVMLYVDESNTPAIRVYERLGFSRWDIDVCYRTP